MIVYIFGTCLSFLNEVNCLFIFNQNDINFNFVESKNNEWVGVMHMQAKSILMLAHKKVEEEIRMRTPTGAEPSTPTIVQSPHHVHSPGTGLSMKRSLQQFLQKRKSRVQEASPYHRQLNVKRTKQMLFFPFFLFCLFYERASLCRIHCFMIFFSFVLSRLISSHL